MARVRGVYLRKPPKGPSAYTSKEAALIANPSMLVADAAFPKNRMESVKNAAFRVNSGGRGEWSSEEFYAIWEYAQDIVLRVKPDDGEGSVEVLGFEEEGTVIGEDGKSIGTLDALLKEEGVEMGGWVLLIGVHPAPDGWAEVVSAPGSRKRKRRRGSHTDSE
jgi:hypothetical protein